MPKYYVRSGQLECIVLADNPKEAAEIAILSKTNGEEIDYTVYIDERGFRGPCKTEPTLNTEFLPEYFFETEKLMDEWNES